MLWVLPESRSSGPRSAVRPYDEEDLRRVVGHTVVHEIARFFGIRPAAAEAGPVPRDAGDIPGDSNAYG